MDFRDNKIMLIDDSNNTNNLIKFFFEKEDIMYIPILILLKR